MDKRRYAELVGIKVKLSIQVCGKRGTAENITVQSFKHLPSQRPTKMKPVASHFTLLHHISHVLHHISHMLHHYSRMLHHILLAPYICTGGSQPALLVCQMRRTLPLSTEMRCSPKVSSSEMSCW